MRQTDLRDELHIRDIKIRKIHPQIKEKPVQHSEPLSLNTSKDLSLKQQHADFSTELPLKALKIDQLIRSNSSSEEVSIEAQNSPKLYVIQEEENGNDNHHTNFSKTILPVIKGKSHRNEQLSKGMSHS